MKDLHILALSLTLAVLLTACSDPDGNFPGSEYMPDMAHSIALEANTYNYYYYNTWNDRSTVVLGELAYPKYTVEGVVPPRICRTVHSRYGTTRSGRSCSLYGRGQGHRSTGDPSWHPVRYAGAHERPRTVLL